MRPYPVDLQVHTTHSDGAWSPEAVFRHAAELGVHTLALTDHDVPGDPAWIALAVTYGIQLIPGIEVMCRDADQCRVDLLGLGVDWGSSGLRRYADRIARGQRAWTAAIAPRLESLLGEAGLVEGLLEDRDFLHEGDLYEIFADRGRIVRGISFGRFACAWTDPGRPLHHPIPEKPNPEEGVALIREAGGVAALTLSGLPRDRWEPLARRLKAAGAQALEVRHPQLDRPEDAEDLATRLDLVWVGGSDFHHPGRSTLGQSGLTEPEAAPLLTLVDGRHRQR